MDRVGTDDTVLTERQVEVLGLREEGRTQKQVATELDTTPSNVSAVERAATANIEKARRTLELVRTLRAPVRFRVEQGATFESVVEAVYEYGDESGIKISYCTPELHSHLYAHLHDAADNNRLRAGVEIAITEDGDVRTRVESDSPASG